MVCDWKVRCGDEVTFGRGGQRSEVRGRRSDLYTYDAILAPSIHLNRKGQELGTRELGLGGGREGN